MIDANEIAGVLKLPCVISGEMQNVMRLWEDAYRNEAAWQKKRVRSLRLPSVVCKEIKRLTLKEFTAKVSDEGLDSALQRMLPMLRRRLDYALAMGGLLFKPYWTPSGLRLDLVTQNEFLPLHYTDDHCTSAACPETITIGRTSYTRIEVHMYDEAAQTHTIDNYCFRSDNPDFLGQPCDLAEVAPWAGILPHKVFPGVSAPLFAVFQVPDSNSVDPKSPLGISCFADAVDDIRDADIQWERILWELESSERAIDASEDLFRFKEGRPVLPKGRERMFRTFSSNPSKTGIFETFSPEIRDVSQFNALNEMLRRVENNCGLSYGTLSRVDTTDKTAEEILSSKQRSYDRVSDIQAALRTTLEGTVQAMQFLRDYYENQPRTHASLTCTFGDGVFEDTNKEYARRMQMVTGGLLSKVEFLMWYFDCDEDTARQKLPEAESLFSGGGMPSLLR